MKNITKILILLFVVSCFASLLGGCKPQYLHHEREVIVEKNIEYVEVVRDSIIRLPADTSSLELWFECDSLNQVYLKQISQLQGTRSKQSVSTQTVGKTMIVSSDCTCDSLDIYFTIKDRYFKEDSKQEVKEAKEVPVKLSKKCRCFSWFTSGLIAGLVLSIATMLVWKYYGKSKFKILWQTIRK